MATPYQMLVPARDTGLLPGVEPDDGAAARASALLQQDLESHHVFFNDKGFHNHMAHQLLTLYGTGAGPALLQQAYDKNKAYQAPAAAPDPAVIAALQADWAGSAPRFLGRGAHYPDFLAFFQHDVARHGGEAVLARFLWADDAPRLGLRRRLFAGLLHPLLQLLYAVEWAQPALVAEALAQTAVHDARVGDFLARVDDEAAAAADEAVTTPPPLPAVLDSLRRDHPRLAASARWDDANALLDGVLARAGDEAVALLAQMRVRPDDDLDERTAEMLHSAAYLAAAAAPSNPPYLPKFDFFLLHHLTAAPFFLALARLDAVPRATRARLLESKMRLDVVQYVARGCPPLAVDAIRARRPRDHDAPAVAHHPRDLLPRFHAVVDDGHAVKTARALVLAQHVSRSWPGRPWVRFDDDQVWLHAMYMLLHSVEGQEVLWVRGAGFQEAWKGLPKEPSA